MRIFQRGANLGQPLVMLSFMDLVSSRKGEVFHGQLLPILVKFAHEHQSVPEPFNQVCPVHKESVPVERIPLDCVRWRALGKVEGKEALPEEGAKRMPRLNLKDVICEANERKRAIRKSQENQKRIGKLRRRNELRYRKMEKRSTDFPSCNSFSFAPKLFTRTNGLLVKNWPKRLLVSASTILQPT